MEHVLRILESEKVDECYMHLEARWICGRLYIKNYRRNGCLFIGEKTAILYKIHHSYTIITAPRLFPKIINTTVIENKCAVIHLHYYNTGV